MAAASDAAVFGVFLAAAAASMPACMAAASDAAVFGGATGVVGVVLVETGGTAPGVAGCCGAETPNGDDDGVLQAPLSTAAGPKTPPEPLNPLDCPFAPAFALMPYCAIPLPLLLKALYRKLP